MRRVQFSILLLFAALAEVGSAGTVTVAVASNFARPAQDIAKGFEVASGHSVRITTASTGKLYAQIVNGLPVDVLLAADAERPRLLEASGIGIAGTRFTYATGGLVLWSQAPAMPDTKCEEALADLGQRHLAVANPLTAPYGVAAREFLVAAGFWTAVQPQLVYGENISQALHFVVSGNAEFGLIAHSQSIYPHLPESSCEWHVPEHMHQPIEQQAIQLQRSDQGQVAAEFLAYLAGPEAQAIIGAHGYKVRQ